MNIIEEFGPIVVALVITGLVVLFFSIASPGPASPWYPATSETVGACGY